MAGNHKAHRRDSRGCHFLSPRGYRRRAQFRWRNHPKCACYRPANCAFQRDLWCPSSERSALAACRFFKRYQDAFAGLCPPGQPRASAYNGSVAVYTYTAAFCAEFDYLISDTTEMIHSLTVRAFLHLQRTIVADIAVAEKWQKAFKDGERACERLGVTCPLNPYR